MSSTIAISSSTTSRSESRIGERRCEHHVGHHLERDVEVVVGDARVDDGRLAGRGGVELATHRVEELGDLDGVVALRPLEEQVLDEVRTPALAKARRASRPRSRAPIAAERTPSMRSVITRSPPDRVVSRWGFTLSTLIAGAGAMPW